MKYTRGRYPVRVHPWVTEALVVIVAVFALASSSACFGLIPTRRRAPEPQVVVKQLGKAPKGSAAGQVVPVVLYKSVAELPRGFFFARGRGTMKLHVAEKFPTGARPHVVIAALGATPPAASSGYLRPADIQRVFMAKAQELGANGLFVQTGNQRVAYAVYVSPASAQDERPSQHVLLHRAIQSIPDVRPMGKAERHDMAAAPSTVPVSFATKRGYCYALAFALDPDAELGDSTARGFGVQARSADPLMGNRSHVAVEKVVSIDGFDLRAPSNGRYLNLRSGALDLGCAWESSTRVEAKISPVGRGAGVLGTGHYWTRLYRRTIGRAALDRKKRAHDAVVAQARVDAERQRREIAQQRARDNARDNERRRRDNERRRLDNQRRQQQRNSSSSGSSTSNHYSFSLKNDCKRTVKLKISSSSGNPKFSGGTSTSISSNTIRSFSGTGPTYFWIVDDSGNGLSSFSANGGQSNMRIMPGCGGFSTR